MRVPIATKIARLEEIAFKLGSLQAMATAAEVPSAQKALRDASASVAYALRQLRGVQASSVSPEACED